MTAQATKPRRSPWPWAIGIGLALTMLANAGFIYMALTHADSVAPSYTTAPR